MIRTHEAGTLRADHAEQNVVLAGWVARRRDHGGVVFLDLRDASGIVQVVVREDELAHDLRSEYCIKVTGTVRIRPEGNENPDIATGEIEVVASHIEVLSESRRRRSRWTGTRRSLRKPGSATATWTCAAPRRLRRCVSAPGRPTSRTRS